MCGIFCLVTKTCTSSNGNTSDSIEKFKVFKENIARRGPDYLETTIYEVDGSEFLVAASVLWLQGANLTTQPVKNPNSVLVYNGDIFGGSLSDESRSNIGDTTLFLDLLENSKGISNSLHTIHGPYAFIYHNLSLNTIYFGRDVYGRRSLLIGKYKDDLVLTSVAKRITGFDCIELPSIGTFSVDLHSNHWTIFPWNCKNRNFYTKLLELETFLSITINITGDNDVEEFRTPLSPSHCDLTLFNEIRHCEANKIFSTLLENECWSSRVLELEKLLCDSVKKRISTQPKFCQNCFRNYNCRHSLTGILFSGGVDCAILALLADKFTDKEYGIDLINVAFDSSTDYQTPDRLTGIETFKELQSLCPDRKWNFVSVNVTDEELNMARAERIADLIYPLKTILDDSLGCAVWFASRGKTDAYRSPCRVLLVGMGADELFGGYSRHRAALNNRGWDRLSEVLDEDWQNISHRNLARDDRVVADHGRQLRTPYLDEDVVNFVRNLQPWEKTFPSNEIPQGFGEKILLRSLAYHLGLKNAATFKKRAFQFGSRIANPKEKGHDISLRL